MQLGTSYKIGQTSNKLFASGRNAGARYINAQPDEVGPYDCYLSVIANNKSSLVFGASTTQLFRNLSISIKWSPGDELIVSKLDHEANIASWVFTAERLGLKLKWWTVPPQTNPQLKAEQLQNLLTPKTRLVACTHCSNILGTIHDIKAIADVVHTVPGAMIAVDGTAYMPHRRVDVKQLGVDFYCFSWYKVSWLS